MIYLIGGCPRVGKSTLAQKIVEEKNIPNIPLDVLVHVLKDSIPKFDLKNDIDVANKFFPFLDSFIKHSIFTVPDYVLEGVIFTPAQVHKLQRKYKIKACFLGTSKTSLEHMLRYTGHNNWMSTKSRKHLEKLPATYIERSEYFKKESKKYGFRYFDMSQGKHAQSIEKAYQYLFSR